jgi:hypothetical protein
VHARESLAARGGCDNHLRHYLRPDQRSAAQGPAFEPPCGGIARCSAYGLDWSNEARAFGKWILRFNDPELMWKVLALCTTFAGNLTIIGSIANMIVIESARQHLEVSFWDYARLGIPIAILTTAAGVILLLVLGGRGR